MTEDEARMKWCPFARAADDWADKDDYTIAVASTNRHHLNGTADNRCLCIGSDCMAWRELRDNGEVYGGYCGMVPT